MMPVDGDGLALEPETKKLSDSTKPKFKPPHCRLPFDHSVLVGFGALNTFKKTFVCPKCGILVVFSAAQGIFRHDHTRSFICHSSGMF